MTTPDDLALLQAAAELTERRVTTPASSAWHRLHGRDPSGPDWVTMRMSLLRLEREGLLSSDPDLNIEVTDTGREVLRPRSSA